MKRAAPPSGYGPFTNQYHPNNPNPTYYMTEPVTG